MKQSPYNKITESRKKTVVSLLIPRKQWKRLEGLKRKSNKSSAACIAHLLEKHQNGKNSALANHSKLTTQYQDPGLKLKKHSFWVDPLLWHRFKSLARFYGISMCLLFTALFSALENLGTDIKKYPPLIIKLHEKVKIPLRTALRRYKLVGLDTS